MITAGAKNLERLKDGETFQSNWSLKKFLGWNPQETIIVGSDFIGFEMKKGGKSDTIFLPVADIYVNMSKKKLFSSKIDILGIQNILPKGKFPRELADKIRETIKVPATDKTSKCHARFLRIFRLWVKQKEGSIGLIKSDDRLVLSLSKKERKRLKTKGNEINTIVLNLKDIIGFASEKCKLFGPRNVRIAVYGHNMRWAEGEGQHDTHIYTEFNKMSDFAPIAEYLESKGVTKYSWKGILDKR